MKKSVTDRNKGNVLRVRPDLGPRGYNFMSSTAMALVELETYGADAHLPTCGRHIGAMFRLDQLDRERQD